MNKYVVKVFAKGTSTAFLHFPTNPREAYVICALHSIADKATLELVAEIKIEFFADSKGSYTTTPDDKIIKGSSTDSQDIAIIIIPREQVPPDITEEELPRLIQLRGKESKCQVKGLPASTDNKLIRTLYDGKIVDDKNYEHQIQLVVSDPLTNHPDADQLVEGLSGSPLIIQVGAAVYCFGVLTDYEEESKRVTGFNFHLLNELLLEAGQATLNLAFVETDESILSDISLIERNTSRVLRRTRNKIGQHHLDRSAVVKEITDSIESKSVTLITGVAGAGKSSATKNALDAMRNQYEIIALQGEQLDKKSIELIFSDPAIGVQGSFGELINSPAFKDSKIVLIDSLEKIYETLHTDVIADFFALLRSRTDLKIVLTCRTYASEYLQIRYLREFPPVSIYDVPLLNDEEFKEIVQRYPTLESISVNDSIKEILRVPFNLDKATMLGVERVKEINTSCAFKNLVWSYVIEDHDREESLDTRIQRGLVLEELAVERARRMASFVNLSSEKNRILSKLLASGIIEQSVDSTKGYAIAHDIYEDWALSRVIAKAFGEYYPVQPVEYFFEAIGYSPAIRRSYRQWLGDGLSTGDTDIENFVLALLRLPAIRYWQDETLLAILRPLTFRDFTKKHPQVFFESDNQLFKRCVLLLNVACQTPDYEFLEMIPVEDRSAPYSNLYLIPRGKIWAVLLEFIADNIHTLSDQFEFILPIIGQWEKIIRYYKPLPKESIYVGKIILAYFEGYKNDIAEEKYRRDSKQFSKMVALFLKLTELFQQEVGAILRNAVALRKAKKRFRIDDFHSKFIDKVLSWLDSKQVSKYLPDTVISAAREEWFYVPPTPEELAEYDTHVPIVARGRIEEHDETVFGVASTMRRDYFPTSAVQTPIYHLLLYHPLLTTRFIVELFNHSVESYWKSDFMVKDSEIFHSDPRTEITYTLADGTTVTQHGSSILWCMYRGGRIATPYLLQSVLRALEKRMLELADLIARDSENKYPKLRDILNAMTEELLKNSKTVSTTAVVVSVATAHYSLMAEYLLPLLRVKEVYEWDFERSIHESGVLDPAGSGITSRIIFEENKRSRNLPHRKQNLRYVVMNLSFSTWRPHMESILDNFYVENDQDEKWRFMLNSLDYRKLEIVKEVEQGFIVQPKLDPELQAIADRDEPRQKELQAIQEAGHWALVKLRDQQGVCSAEEFETWERYFKTAFRDDIAHPQASLFNHPASFAFLGLKNFYDRLSNDQMEASIRRVFSLINRDLQKSWNPYDMDLNSPFSSFEKEPAYLALVEIMVRGGEAIKTEAKELCFWAIVMLNDKSEKEKLIENVRIRLPELMPSFVSGVCEWNRGHPIRMQLRHFLQFNNNWLPGKGFWGIVASVTTLFKKGLRGFRNVLHARNLQRQEAKCIGAALQRLRETNPTIPLDEELSAKGSPYFMVIGIELTPRDTTEESLIAHMKWVLDYFFKNIDIENGWSQDKIHYEQLQQCEKAFAEFLLAQPSDVSVSFFDLIIDGYKNRERGSRKLFDFVDRTLKEVMSQCQEKDIDQFWMLWERLYDKVSSDKDKRFLSTVMLDYEYWFSIRENWKPVKGKSRFFEKVIMNEKGLVKETAKLLSGLGFPELLPHGLHWLWKQIQEHGIDDESESEYTEKLVTEMFYNVRLRTMIQHDVELRESYIGILDRLIDRGAPSAYLIREDVISFSTIQS